MYGTPLAFTISLVLELAGVPAVPWARERVSKTASTAVGSFLLSGRVTRHGVPAAGVRIVLQGLGAERATRTEEDGRYELRLLVPGEYVARIENLDDTITIKSIEISAARNQSLDFHLDGMLVSGTVVDSTTGRPLAGVSVDASPVNASRFEFVTSLTGPDGHFRFELVAGEHEVSAFGQAYVPEKVTMTVTSTGAPELWIAMAKGAPIYGRILDMSSRPVGGVVIGAASVTPDGSRSDGTVSAADGSFRFDELGPGTYDLLAASEAAGFATVENVRAGDGELILVLRPGGRIRLCVIGPDGAPLAGARVETLVNDHPLLRERWTDALGMLDLHVPPGPVVLAAERGRLRGELTFDVSEAAVVDAVLRLSEIPSESGP